MALFNKLTAIADAIRNKTNITRFLTLDEMPTLIESITTGSDPKLQTKTVTPTKATQNVVPDSTYDGLSKVTVNPIPSDYIIPNYQTKTATPTKSSQSITPDSGYDGLSKVTVNAIPAAYQDVTSVTAVASDVLSTKKFVNSSGTVVTGSMTNRGAVTATITGMGTSTGDTYYTIPAGYHSGSGKVSLTSDIETALSKI